MTGCFMRRVALNSLVLAIIVITMTSCSLTMGERLKTGLNDIITSPLQVRDNVRTEIPKAQFAPFGAVGGSVKGGFYMGKQIVNGVMTILAFFKAR